MNTERTHTSNVLAFPKHTDYAGSVQGPYKTGGLWRGILAGLTISVASVALVVVWLVV